MILLFCFIALPTILTFLSLLSAHSSQADTLSASYDTRTSRLRALFSFHTPSSLFPPSAVISLTDDNSTFFLARPAAFGPPLPSKGLSAQLWVGSGFGDDNMRRGGAARGAEGELGCSDVPGWGEGIEKDPDTRQSGLQSPKSVLKNAKAHAMNTKVVQDGEENDMRSNWDSSAHDSDRLLPHTDDGTDDHLHHPFPESNPAERARPGQPAEHEAINEKGKRPTHADIQSLQESAEIAGKVVLLSRGGCGFLEKVKWVQRRGGIALIVGDDERGGPLIVMYARGDTSNVTISALFTSHTTAHLLSSLIPPESFDDQSGDDVKDLGEVKASKKASLGSKTKAKAIGLGPVFTTSKTAPQSTGTRRPSSDQPSRHEASARVASGSWGRTMLSMFGLKGKSGYPWHMSEDSRRPPSSGNIDWILLEEWEDEQPVRKPEKKGSALHNADSAKPDRFTGSQASRKTDPEQFTNDDFVIGVQDWRDRDLVAPNRKGGKASAGSRHGKANIITKTAPSNDEGKEDERIEDTDTFEGGSITPGSGEYDNSHPPQSRKHGSKSSEKYTQKGDGVESSNEINGATWLSRVGWSHDDSTESLRDVDQPSSQNSLHSGGKSLYTASSLDEVEEEEGGEHEGLWVTLTPTNMSTSPFFDTLLVLVVSPLVTLTVVYALLLLRSRIRRRRWRAPKSVVDRLPVRTYHTISSSSSTTSSQLPTPNTSSPTSPLLRSAPRPVSTRIRPRSQTTSSVVPASNTSSNPTIATSVPAKDNSMHGSPRGRRYNGRQIECVVCLEEYVDGQSRVMSLPCGHEFHVECM